MTATTILCHHYELPESCWIVNLTTYHFVVIVISTTEMVGGNRNCESVVMIRDITKANPDAASHIKMLERLTVHGAELRKSEAKGTARAKLADVGTTFAIGAKIAYDSKKKPNTRVLCAAPSHLLLAGVL